MFYAAVNALGNEEQRKKWIPLIRQHKILGCYAQTEIGHGSDVSRLETTATLDKATDEFVIHSPTLTSTKFWPGDMGRFTTHALVFARLLIDGKDYGVQAFVVQTRDVDTFKHMKGVKTGDMGHKVGYQSKDNGWASFDHVRIPRANMMMRIVNIDKDGNFDLRGDPKVLYTTMMLIRQIIISDMPQLSMRALLVAIRYASCRRQFKTLQGSKNERKVIDYQTWQASITPLLAKTIGFLFVSHHVKEEFRTMYEQVQQGEFGKLDVMHHILAGLKALFSEEGIIMIDIARRSTGGAGYLSGSGFNEIMEQASPVPTFEGDNTVMLLQSSRYVFKLVKKAKKG